MTPMSDVMVLLLTFFMLTATFVKEEPIKVQSPGSVSDVKIPETNLLTIFVNKDGKVFMTMDKKEDLAALADNLQAKDAFNLTEDEKKTFSESATFGMPFNLLKSWLSPQNEGKRDELLQDAAAGIPCDSANDELKEWIKAAREVNDDMRIAIKADKETSYAVIKKVMDSLRSIHENRYNLITDLQGKNED